MARRRLRNPFLTTIYFRDPEEAGFFAMRMNGDVTPVKGLYGVTFDWRQF